MYEACGCGHEHLITLATVDDYRTVLHVFLQDVHSGRLTPESIQPDYYFNLAKKLNAAVAEGLGGGSFGGDDFKNSLKAFLDHNVYAFSGAKSLAVMQQYNKLLQDDKGEIKPYNTFKSDVVQVDNLYNKTYLEAEYNNAVASAQMAEKWQGFSVFQMLEYRTVGDDRVRPEHAVLDGLILRSTDPLWNKIYPPNAWNCRCTVVPAGINDIATEPADAKDRANAAGIQPFFKGNVGKQKVIYKDSHPYFKIENRLAKELDAEKNYGMPSPERIYATADLPTYKEQLSKTDALGWWTKTADGINKPFEVKAKDGLSVIFDKGFKNHVLEDNSDNRWRFLHLSQEVVANPDEVWSNRIKETISQIYIKYYEKYPIVVAVDAQDKVRAVTMYEAQKDGKLNFKAVKNLRKGVLKYKR